MRESEFDMNVASGALGKAQRRTRRNVFLVAGPLWMVAILWVMSFGHSGNGAEAGGTGRKTLLILGDSLAAGYGVEESEAFPRLLQRMADREGIPVDVVNAGVSGDTTAGGLRRLKWLLRKPVNYLMIELGGNDGLRGLPVEATRSNLVAIVTETRAKNPGVQVVLAGMQMPPNLGEDYAGRFARIYPEIAREQTLELIPHLLEGVGGKPEMNLADLIHPTPEGHARVASNIWVVLRPMLIRSAR